MVSENKDQFEAITTLLGGANEAVDSLSLREDQFAFGLNISQRGGIIRTRPVWKKIKQLSQGKFQGVSIYNLNSEDRIVYSIAGVVSTYNITTGTVTAIGNLDAVVDRIYFCKVAQYFVAGDGINSPISFLEDTVVPNTIPIGTLMAYGHGRLFIVPKFVPDNAGVPTTESGKPYFLAGDIIKPWNPTSVLAFTETNYLNEGGAMGLPNENGFIHGMAFMRNAATGTGVGALVVFARAGAGAFAVNSPRTQWKDIDLSQVLFTGIGTESPFSIVTLNGDIAFRGQDGIRTIKYSKGEKSEALTNSNMSYEVKSVIARDLRTDLPFVSSAVVDNRLFVTSGGRDSDGCFRAVVALDLMPIHLLSGSQAAAHNGIWTGLQFRQIFSGQYQDKQVLFAIVKRGDESELWYLDEEGYADHTDTKPLCRIYTRSFFFKSLIESKKLKYIDSWIKELRGQAMLTCYWRPDGYKLWNSCNTISICSGDAGISQGRQRLRFTPKEAFDPITDKNLLVGTSFQFCIEWRGNLALEKEIFCAIGTPDESFAKCVDEECKVLTAGTAQNFELDNYEYLIPEA